MRTYFLTILLFFSVTTMNNTITNNIQKPSRNKFVPTARDFNSYIELSTDVSKYDTDHNTYARNIYGDLITDKNSSAKSFYDDEQLQLLIGNVAKDCGLDDDEREALQWAIYREGAYVGNSKLKEGYGGCAKRGVYNSDKNTYDGSKRFDSDQLYDSTLFGLDSFYEQWTNGSIDYNMFTEDECDKIDKAIANGFKWHRNEAGDDCIGFSLPFETMTKCVAADIRGRNNYIKDLIESNYKVPEGVSNSELISASYVGGNGRVKQQLSSGTMNDWLNKYVRPIIPSNLVDKKEGSTYDVISDDGLISTVIDDTNYNNFVTNEDGSLSYVPFTNQIIHDSGALYAEHDSSSGYNPPVGFDINTPYSANDLPEEQMESYALFSILDSYSNGKPFDIEDADKPNDNLGGKTPRQFVKENSLSLYDVLKCIQLNGRITV